MKRSINQVHGKESRKKKRGKSEEAKGTDDWSAGFKEMWEKSLQLENERFERSMKMFEENQRRQMEQTASLLSGFKDIMKDLMKK